MDLNSILVSEFAKITNDNKETVNEGATVYGTYRVDGDGAYVQIDGSDTRTPVATTSEARNGDRVTVLIKNHRAIITGNLTDPSTTVKSVEERIETGVGTIQETIDNLKTQLDNQEITLDDYRKAIAEAKRMATDYIDFTAGTGLVIGSSSISSNVRIYSGGIDIRDGNTILASYTDDVIYLGNASGTATIDLCNGTGYIVAFDDNGQYNADLLSIKSSVNMKLIAGSTIKNVINLTRSSIDLSCGSICSIYMSDYASNGITLSCGDYSLNISNSGISIPGYSKTTHTHSGYASSSHDHYGDTINPDAVHCSGNVRGDKITVIRPGSTTKTQAGLLSSSSYGGYLLVEYSGSSKRYKHGFHSLNDELKEKIRKLYDIEVKSWTYNDDYLSDEDELYQTETFGLIAEDVAEVLPEAVYHNDNGDIDNYRDRHILNAMLVLLQEQKKQIDSLEYRIEALEKKEA